MIVKYGSGTGGIRDYLENGKKQGRELSRDELDQRIVLEGDLELCEKISESRKTDGAQYAHITLGFTEDELKLNPDLLKLIVQDYKQFAFGNGAFQEDELYFYAEAHMPKTASERVWNALEKKYEIKPRLIHVHIIIPTTNLISGQRAAPFEAVTHAFGTDKTVLDYSDAIKETINGKYGLTSPNSPAHRRTNGEGKAEIISRIKGDNFASVKRKNHDTLKEIRNQILDKNIIGEPAFKEMLVGMGYEVDTGNSKNDGRYFKIKLAGSADKWTRLDDDQFRAAYLNKTMEQKIQYLEDAAVDRWNAEAPARAIEHAKLLAEWGNRARIEKYVSYGTKIHKEYLTATPAEKSVLLDVLEAKFYGRTQKVFSESDSKVAKYFIAMAKDERNFELSDEGRAHQIRLENYSSAQLNKAYLRTSEQIDAARKLGDGLLEKPKDAIFRLTANESIFTESALQSFVLKNTADADQYDQVMKSILAHPDLIIQHSDKGLSFTSVQVEQTERELLEITKRLAANHFQSREQIDAQLSALPLKLIQPVVVAEMPQHDQRILVAIGRQAQKEEDTVSNLNAIKSLHSTQTLNSSTGAGIPADKIEAALAAARHSDPREKGLNKGQESAFRLLCSGRRLVVVNGAAGTGKSFVLSKMREVFEAEGFELHGAILQGKTAEDLQRDSGIKSSTIASMLFKLELGTLRFNKKTVIVIDEGGMVGSSDYLRLMQHVEKAGARMMLVGDAKQLSAVSFGNAFTEISKLAEVAEITEIMRQRDVPWMCAASEKLAKHDMSAIRDYFDKGHVHFADTLKDAQLHILEKWTRHRLENLDPKIARIVLVHTNAERIALNGMMRDQLKKEGHLKGEIDVVTEGGIRKMAVGDKIMFTAPDSNLNVKNGTSGLIVKISDSGLLTIKTENGDTVEIHANGRKTHEGTKGNIIEHAYAVTVHKSQGMTVNKAFMLFNPSMSKENIYVAATRHMHDIDVVVSKEDFADIDKLIDGLTRSGQKTFTQNEKEWTAERPADSVIGQIIAGINADKIIEKAAQSANFKEILDNLDPQRVLDYVSKSHGVDILKYSIKTDPDGKLSIVHGTKSYTASAFLTNAMHLDYKTEAAPILKQCYSDQLSNTYSMARGGSINQIIAHEFAAYIQERKLLLEDVKETIDQSRRDEKKTIETLPEVDRPAALEALNDRIDKMKADLSTEKGKRTSEVYKGFLATRAVDSEPHLEELRRTSTSTQDHARVAEIAATRETYLASEAAAHAQAEEQAALARIERAKATTSLTPGAPAVSPIKSAPEVREQAQRAVAPPTPAPVVNEPQLGQPPVTNASEEFVSPALTSADRDLFAAARAALNLGNSKQIAAALKRLDKLQSASLAESTGHNNRPAVFDEIIQMKKTTASVQHNIRMEMNNDAERHGEKVLPFSLPGGRLDAAYDYHSANANTELADHQRRTRPAALIEKLNRDGRAFDAERAALQSHSDKWKNAVKQRDSEYTQRLEKAKPEIKQAVDQERQKIEVENVERGPVQQQLRDRHQSILDALKILNEEIGKLPQQKIREIQTMRDSGMRR